MTSYMVSPDVASRNLPCYAQCPIRFRPMK